MADGGATAGDVRADQPAADGTPARRRKPVLWAVVVIVAAAAAATSATRGLTPWEVEARVADVVRARPDSTSGELVRAIGSEFADDTPRFRGSDGAPFSPVSASGVVGDPVVRDAGDEGTVRVALVYAEAPVIPTGSGDMYCLVIDVPAEGDSHRTTAEADFTRPDHCAQAHLAVAQP